VQELKAASFPPIRSVMRRFKVNQENNRDVVFLVH